MTSRNGDHGAEARTAKRLGGRTTPASGALGRKGDFDTATLKAENKATTKDSVTIKRSWLEKIAREAAMEGKQPALTVQFVREDGRPVPDGAWVMLPESLARELLEDD